MTIKILFAIGIICIIGYIFYRIIKSVKKERIARKYRKCMRKGDDVKFNQLSDGMDGRIVELSDNYVTIETKVRKEFIYPKM